MKLLVSVCRADARQIPFSSLHSKAQHLSIVIAVAVVAIIPPPPPKLSLPPLSLPLPPSLLLKSCLKRQQPIANPSTHIAQVLDLEVP